MYTWCGEQVVGRVLITEERRNIQIQHSIPIYPNVYRIWRLFLYYTPGSSFQNYIFYHWNLLIWRFHLASWEEICSCHLFLVSHAMTVKAGLGLLYMHAAQVAEQLQQIAWHLLEDEVNGKYFCSMRTSQPNQILQQTNWKSINWWRIESFNILGSRKGKIRDLNPNRFKME